MNTCRVIKMLNKKKLAAPHWSGCGGKKVCCPLPLFCSCKMFSITPFYYFCFCFVIMLQRFLLFVIKFSKRCKKSIRCVKMKKEEKLLLLSSENCKIFSFFRSATVSASQLFYFYEFALRPWNIYGCIFYSFKINLQFNSSFFLLFFGGKRIKCVCVAVRQNIVQINVLCAKILKYVDCWIFFRIF